MRKSLVFAAVLLGMVSTVTAFPTSLNVVEQTAQVDKPAQFEVEVKNTFTGNRTFRISSISSPDGQFSYTSPQKVRTGQNATFEVNVTPRKSTLQQNYAFTVNVRTIEGDNLEKLDSYFSVTSAYDLNIRKTEINSDLFLPGEELDVNVTIQNTDPSAIEYRLKTSVFGNEVTKTGTAIPGEETEHSFTIVTPENAEPGEHELKILLEGNRNQTITQNVRVAELENVSIDRKEDDRLLEYTRIISAKNTGNSAIEVKVNETVASWLAPLTTFNRTANSTETKNGETTYYWTQNLSPGDSLNVEYTVRYWPPLLLLAAILAGIAVLKYLHTGLTFTKEVSRSEEGITVHIELKNRSAHTARDLEVKDFVPDIASVDEDFPMARPVIRKTENGTRLHWEIDEMAPGEERVLEYRIKPLVEVEGGVTLPEAELESDGRRIQETDSRTVEFKPE